MAKNVLAGEIVARVAAQIDLSHVRNLIAHVEGPYFTGEGASAFLWLKNGYGVSISQEADAQGHVSNLMNVVTARKAGEWTERTGTPWEPVTTPALPEGVVMGADVFTIQGVIVRLSELPKE